MKIHLTSTQVNVAVMREYNPSLKVYASPPYYVPTYKMTVENVGDFEVLRAGLSRSPTHSPKLERECDVGIFAAQTVKGPTWINYTPHTYPPGWPPPLEGAVKVWRTEYFYIHEGPPDREMAMGSYGCAEIVGGWQKFVHFVKAPTLSGRVTLIFDALAKPKAKLAISDVSIRKKLGLALHEKLMNKGKYQGYELTDADVASLMKSAQDGRGVTRQEVQDLFLIALNYVMPVSAKERLGYFVLRHARSLGMNIN